ncbi:MAG: PQQ-binding-like beta-propeller repeat protein [Salinigranum sp.]
MESDEIDYEALDTHEVRTDQLDYGPIATEEDVHHVNTPAPGRTVTPSMLEEDVSNADSWLAYNKGYEQLGFSPADRLTTYNVGGLSREYVIQTDSNGLETNPVVVPGEPPVMYFTQNNEVVKAANARTGEVYWSYQFSLPKNPSYYIAHRERGVGVYEDKVLWGSATAQLVALDQKTGKKLWQADALPQEIKNELPYPWVGYGITHAPIAYDGKVYVGQIGGDSSGPGFTFAQAFDVKSGKRVWKTPMAPKDQWVGDTWKHGNASPWMTPGVDTQTDTVFWNTGNPGPMLNGLVRPGPNQMSAGIVALDAKTGEVNWNSQMAPQDLWDYDGQFTAMLFDMKVDGETRRVVSADHKSGWTFTYDVKTGDLVERSRPFAKQAGNFLGMQPRGKENAKLVWPALTGGTAWPPNTYSPKTGMKYVGANDYVAGEYFTPGWKLTADAGVGGGFTFPKGLGKQIKQWGGVRAVDPASGEIAWEYGFEDYPASSPLQFVGGVSSTAGDLVFGTSSGGNIVALDAESGDKLWVDDTGGRITAGPVVWDDPSQGKQYVAIAADNKIIVYTGS